MPGLTSLVKKAHAIVRQTYSGDITILPFREDIRMGRVFRNATESEARELIEAGRRATWPNIERIRNTTQISRAFDTCLERLAERYQYVKR